MVTKMSSRLASLLLLNEKETNRLRLDILKLLCHVTCKYHSVRKTATVQEKTSSCKATPIYLLLLSLSIESPALAMNSKLDSYIAPSLGITSFMSEFSELICLRPLSL